MTMLDIKYLRNNFTEIKEKLATRGDDLSELERFGELDKKRRELISETEQLKAKRNEASKQISIFKREGKDATEVITEMKEVSNQIKELDKELATIQEDLDHMMLSIPNVPHESAPIGEDEDDNVEARRWGDVGTLSFEPKPHWDVGTNLGILDFETAAKVTGSRFVFYKGLGARLERALINFMMDLHADKHGYTEMLPPY